MYSESDLQSAVDAGVITAASADALRQHVAAQRATPLVDEENFRLLTGFNDIFVVIAIALLLMALGVMAGGSVVAVASWILAEFFTRKRRMALPSIVLLLTFVGGVCMGVLALLSPSGGFPVLFDDTVTFPAATGALVGLAMVAAATAHWFRFRVPITIAAGAISFAFLAYSVLLIMFPVLWDQRSWLFLAGGLAIFAFAMYWDMADPGRRTRRSDVAFWLHLAAAPMIAHPIFAALGVFGGALDITKALVVVLLYAIFACVSLMIDRRALLVSSLIYVLFAIERVFETFGNGGMNAALTALVIGSALLLLSAFWHKARRLVMAPLPQGLKDKLPILDRPMPVKAP